MTLGIRSPTHSTKARRLEGEQQAEVPDLCEEKTDRAVGAAETAHLRSGAGSACPAESLQPGHALAGERKQRPPSLEDAYMQGMLAIEVDFLPPSLRVVRVGDQLQLECGLAKPVIIDNGTEFNSRLRSTRGPRESKSALRLRTARTSWNCPVRARAAGFPAKLETSKHPKDDIPSGHDRLSARSISAELAPD